MVKRYDAPKKPIINGKGLIKIDNRSEENEIKSDLLAPMVKGSVFKFWPLSPSISSMSLITSLEYVDRTMREKSIRNNSF